MLIFLHFYLKSMGCENMSYIEDMEATPEEEEMLLEILAKELAISVEPVEEMRRAEEVVFPLEQELAEEIEEEEVWWTVIPSKEEEEVEKN